MNIDEIIKLAKAVSENGLTSLELEEDGVKLSLKRKIEPQQIIVSQSAAPVQAGAVPAEGLVSAAVSSQVQAAAGNTAVSETMPAGDIGSDKVVVSPLVGTFYASASPDAEAFVKEGDTVKKGQILGIIEAMKLMNEIESEYDGVVEAVLVKNEDVVEYGQPLFRIR